MRAPRANAPLVAILVLLIAALAILATLQYRWIDQVSEAERQRMHASLEHTARQFAGDLSAEIEQIHAVFSRPEGGDAAGRYAEWVRGAEHPSLIEAVFLADEDTLRKLDLQTLKQTVTPWPAGLEPIRRSVVLAQRGPGEPFQPFDPKTLTLITRERRAPGPPPFALDMIERDRRPPHRPPESFDGEQEPLRLDRAQPERREAERWPPPRTEPPIDRRPVPPEDRRMPAAVIIVLNRNELIRNVLPELARRRFSTGPDQAYDLAIEMREGLLYRSGTSWPDGRTPPDVVVPIRMMMPSGEGLGARPRQPDRGPMNPPPSEPPLLRAEDRARLLDPGTPLLLLVRRHDGGLGAIVKEARRRNLLISSGILLVLATAMGVLLFLVRRAERLREQQMEFVAAISHELNTPVAALRSAGENLKDGIVTEPARLVRYGETIVKESARLGDMIEQVLEFAGMRARRDRRHDEVIEIQAVVDEAVAQCRWLTEGNGLRIETQVEPDLPRLSGDPRALTRAVQNLIANAVRHGGAGEWVGIRAFAGSKGSSVTISVEDHGPGIDPGEASHLFEPFYRGRGASAVRGSGLGLTIVQQIAKAHGGSVEVEKRRRTGARFSIHLPVERRP